MLHSDWIPIIQEAVTKGVQVCSGAVPGAKFRHMVAEAAKSRGVEFPPEEMKSFSSFLEQFSSQLIVQRRPGQDMLVAPADEPHLLDIDSFEDAAAELNGAHVLGCSDQRNRRLIEQAIRPYFRFRWFDEKVVQSLAGIDGKSRFLAELARVLREETLWRDKVMPDDTASPLYPSQRLLPCKRRICEFMEIVGELQQ